MLASPATGLVHQDGDALDVVVLVAGNDQLRERVLKQKRACEKKAPELDAFLNLVGTAGFEPATTTPPV